MLFASKFSLFFNWIKFKWWSTAKNRSLTSTRASVGRYLNFLRSFFKEHTQKCEKKLNEGSSAPSIGKIKTVSIVFYLRNTAKHVASVRYILSYCATLSNGFFMAHALSFVGGCPCKIKSLARYLTVIAKHVCAYLLVDRIPLELNSRGCCWCSAHFLDEHFSSPLPCLVMVYVSYRAFSP